MNEEEKALNYVASLLSMNSHDHVSAGNIPTLVENTKDSLKLNRKTAQVLKIENIYNSRISIVTIQFENKHFGLHR